MLKPKIFPVLIVMMLLSGFASGQKYETAAGLRLGYPGVGLTIKHGVKDGYVEGIVNTLYRGGGLNIEVMYQWHWKLKQSLFPTDDLYWFAGGGLSLTTVAGYTGFGVVGVIGLDYTLPKTPINFTIDYKPVFIINYGGRFAYDNGALSVRYTF
ncbi:MAG: hypothetical protein IH948_03540 [Bacteroidetes bacterium]|nr:hypothetical protein [Bacteroidota bacterium]